MIGVIVFIHAISTDKKKIAGAAHNRIQQALYYCLVAKYVLVSIFKEMLLPPLSAIRVFVAKPSRWEMS